MGEAIPLNIAPQIPTSLSTAQAPSTVSVSTMLTSIPTALTSLPRPIALTGTLFDLTLTNAFTMKTSLGIIQFALIDAQDDMLKTLASLFNETTGLSGKLELIVQPGTPPKQAVLLVPKSDTPEQAPKTEIPLKTAETNTPSVLAATGQTKGNKPTSLKITVLPEKTELPIKGDKAMAQAAPGKETSNLPKFLTKILDKAETTTEATVTSPTTPRATASKNEAVATAATQPSQASKNLESGHSYQLKLMQTLPPQSEWPDEAPLPDQIRATVVGKSLTGQTILQSDKQTLFVHEKSDLPIGTKIIAQATLVEEDPVTLLPHSKDKDFLPVREIVETLQTISQKGADAFLHSRLPTPAHHFAGTALFLLSALHSGKLDEWMGPATLHVLEKENKGKLKEKLIDAMQESLDSAPRDRTVGEWKAYPLPLHYEGAYELMKLYVHHDGHNAQSQAQDALKITKTRFVITMNMSRLGPIQVDGLSQKRQLDLVIRSERELPDPLTTTLRETAIKSLEAVGLVGTLMIQSGRQNWITFEDDKSKPDAVVT